MGRVKVDCSAVAVSELAAAEIEQMFALFEKFYDCVSFETFCTDLYKKDRILLARERDTWRIAGFTTLKIMSIDFERGGRKQVATGIFSGDTILAPEYWGCRVLNSAFASLLLKEKMKRPFGDLYWFLISKGYKTYLLLTNNFLEYYPALHARTPAHVQQVMDSYASELYPEAYDKASGLLIFQESLGQLKTSVAPIDGNLMESQPNVAFFQNRNPDWQKGNELVCLGVIDWRLFGYYVVKAARCATMAWVKRAKKILRSQET
ncbi:MAG: hypothetical protein KF799_10230 [Bdellovibrionales bacterium]|nr:hypothetical protein [Bdellovibrionales bacterium]